MNPWTLLPEKVVKTKKNNAQCNVLLNIRSIPVKIEKKAIEEVISMDSPVQNAKKQMTSVDMTVEEFALNSILNSHLKRNKKLKSLTQHSSTPATQVK